MIVDTVCVDTERLLYRAEGNANLVLSMPDTRQVLRLRKSTKLSKNGKCQMQNLMADVRTGIAYMHFIAPFFGECYTVAPKLVTLADQHNFDAFNEWLLQFRPAERLHKEVRCRFGGLYPDVAFLPDHLAPVQNDGRPVPETYCVEIKPKQGWTFYDSGQGMPTAINNCRPPASVIDVSDRLPCRFCCMQYLKLAKETISQRSNYCPIDLFSGCRNRMRKAIRALIESPQNNLRIFHNGRNVYGGSTSNSANDKIELIVLLRQIFDRSTTATATATATMATPTAPAYCNSNETIIVGKFVDLLIEILLKDFTSTASATATVTAVAPLATSASTAMATVAVAVAKAVTVPGAAPLAANHPNPADTGKLIEPSPKSTIAGCRPTEHARLPAHCVLRSVLNIQLLAKPSLDVCRIDKPNGGITDRDDDDDGNGDDNDDCRPLHYVDDLLAKGVGPRSIDCLTERERYLLGATALDCSIMLAFQPYTVAASATHTQSTSGVSTATIDFQRHTVIISDNNSTAMRFVAKATVMDLDPKAASHYRKYIKQTNASQLAYEKRLIK